MRALTKPHTHTGISLSDFDETLRFALRERAPGPGEEDLRGAIDELSRDEAGRARLEEALRPFSKTGACARDRAAFCVWGVRNEGVNSGEVAPSQQAEQHVRKGVFTLGDARWFLG